MNWKSFDYFIDSSDSSDSQDLTKLSNLKNDKSRDNFKYISEEDLIESKNSYFYNKIIEDNLESLKNKNNECMKYNNKNICWCCDNYIVIHNSNINNFIEKYIYKNKYQPKQSSKLIKILYRLHPEYFAKYDITKINSINNLYRSYLSIDSYQYVYDNYFKSNVDETMLNGDYYNCTICRKIFCLTHTDYNPFYSCKCKHCNKYWNICLWCQNENIIIFFDRNIKKLSYEKSLCNIYHNFNIKN